MTHTVSSLKEETKEHQLLTFASNPASEVLQPEALSTRCQEGLLKTLGSGH